MAAVKQRHSGQFQPGQSGNPLGYPKIPPDVKARLKGLNMKAVQAIEDALDGDDQKLRLAAAQEVLNRNLGKPHVSATVDVNAHDSGAAMLAALTAAAARSSASPALVIDATAERAPAPPLPTLPPIPLASIPAGDEHED
ncbi:hypothetical protein [Rhizobium mesoamericanum]|uniref:DUF5681 domain-containing protein n=1 Tax=Rhizobium mesoamericanum STM3625 TaxID=1211777 RepID=K0Q1W2_9HYPH|nr:hypothetical protein [Rhizobium mesoamericanum]CCM78037.1 conserved hypothetical protein [Rhizobium mesoamericanum STM3625]